MTHADSFLPPMTDPLFTSFSVFSHCDFQPAEVFEFDGNVYSHHLSPIARKHSLIAGVCVQMQHSVHWSPWCRAIQIENRPFCNWMLKCIELETKISLVNLPVSLIVQAVHGMFPTVQSRQPTQPPCPCFLPQVIKCACTWREQK